MMTANRLRIRWKPLAWVVAGVTCFGLSLIATFPYGALHTRLVSAVTNSAGIDVRIGEWSIDWPLGITWRQVTLLPPEWEPIRVGLLRASVGLLDALGGRPSLELSLQLEDGAPAAGLATATFTAASWPWEEPVSVAGRLRRIDLSKVLARYGGRGMLNGEFSHHIDPDRPPQEGSVKGEGTWRAEATDVAIDRLPVGTGRTLSVVFAKVSTAGMCRNTVCEVTELRGEGDDGSFTGEGSVTLREPVLDSELALTITLVPGPGFAPKAHTLGLPPFPAGTPITVKIVGPLARARIAL